MSIRRLFQLAVVCLLITGLFAGSASAAGYVWCVGADGEHAALEFAPSGDCSGDDCASLPDGSATLAHGAEGDSCGPCQDLSAADQWHVSRSRQGEAPVAAAAVDVPVAAAVAVPLPLPERFVNSHRLIDFPPQIPAPVLHQRTTVLLI
ncbi:MAG: hypothetical protein FDZ69_05485 [Deltaproteobacteria bacterium]|nr:MAG: hypothetical protein FDZ69_05485 [Deltaproteobacteria bacterium]